MRLTDGLDLTYCTNIHPGDGWDEVFANIDRCGRTLKARLSPSEPFALGLRLSNREAEQLLEPGRLDQFAAYLADNGLYVSLINGYPYGPFHGTPVKAAVFEPDWRRQERVDYTLRLLRIVAALMPAGGEGGVSTVPLSYKPWLSSGAGDALPIIVRHLVTVAAAMVREKHTTGRRLRLDIEPEPYGLIENSAEAVAFFRDWLLPVGAPLLGTELSISTTEAASHLREHVCLCFDACHFAVAFEEPDAAVDALLGAGIRIGRVQVSSALTVKVPGPEAAAALAPFAGDRVYLHQVGESSPDGFRQFPDLVEAMPTIGAGHPREWRIHFHVPVFTSEYGVLGSTQDSLSKLLRRNHATPFTGHLEIETYTWEVLPPGLRVDVVDSTEREYRWVLAHA